MIDRRDLLLAATAMTAAASLPSQKSQAADDSSGSLPVRFALNMSTIRGQKLSIVQQVEVAAKAGYDGIEPWIRVFQNLRASRETELVEDFPVHVVTEWLGNSPDTAAKHYLTVRDIHLERAVGGDIQSRGTYMGHTMAVTGCQELTSKNGGSTEVPDVEGVGSDSQCESIRGRPPMAPPRGVEPLFPG
jgi:hypothetical protein